MKKSSAALDRVWQSMGSNRGVLIVYSTESAKEWVKGFLDHNDFHYSVKKDWAGPVYKVVMTKTELKRSVSAVKSGLRRDLGLSVTEDWEYANVCNLLLFRETMVHGGRGRN